MTRTDSTLEMWTHYAKEMLSSKVERTNISTTPIELKYIDFFAGSELGELRYAGFRWLQKEGLLEPTSTMIKDDIEYLYPDIPLNIQSKTGERLMHTKEAVFEWKTEVLQQEYYPKRLEQQLMKMVRTDMIQHNIAERNGGIILQTTPSVKSSGWSTMKFTLQLPECPLLKDIQSVYTPSETFLAVPIVFTFPLWQWRDFPNCVTVLKDAELNAIGSLSLEFMAEETWDRSSIWTLDRQREGCTVSQNKIDASCFVSR